MTKPVKGSHLKLLVTNICRICFAKWTSTELEEDHLSHLNTFSLAVIIFV